uniref:Uncharacterized protein n=1 Tax=Oryza punctata TaxID=4537 RepID=A0A0E0L1E8_ORYPU
MATTHAQRRSCLLFMALVFAVATGAAAARPPPSFSGKADGDDGNVLVVAGSRDNRLGIMHDVPSGQNPIHNDHPSPHHPPSSSRAVIMHNVPSGQNPLASIFTTHKHTQTTQPSSTMATGAASHRRSLVLIFAVAMAPLVLVAARDVPAVEKMAAVMRHDVPSGPSPVHNGLPTPPAAAGDDDDRTNDDDDHSVMKMAAVMRHDVPSGPSPVHNGLPTPPAAAGDPTVAVPERLVPTGSNPLHNILSPLHGRTPTKRTMSVSDQPRESWKEVQPSHNSQKNIINTEHQVQATGVPNDCEEGDSGAVPAETLLPVRRREGIGSRVPVP